MIPVIQPEKTIFKVVANPKFLVLHSSLQNN